MPLQVKKLVLSEYGIKMKATIQQTGKLSFTEVTAQNLKLEEQTRFAIYQDEKNKNLLYMVRADEDQQAFPVKKSGMYYYMATKTLFDMLGYDYTKTTYIFDILRTQQYDEELGGTSYKLTKREIEKNKPETVETEGN